VKRLTRSAAAVLLTVAAALVLVACGGSSSSSSNSSSTAASSGGKQGGTVTIVSGTPPLSADQGLDFTTQGNELESVVNLPLLTFVRGVQGAAGSKVIPGLAKALPTVSSDKKTYTFVLRSNLKYSDGTPIKASDVKYAMQRDIKIPWQAASFISAYVKGGDAYAKGKAKDISGIVADDSTGTVKINLVAPFSPIVDIMALPGTAPVPPNTPMKNLAATGTIGAGQYKWGAITPGHTYTLVRNPNFSIPGLPRGYADKIVYSVNSNVNANAEQVLNNQADVFDPGDTLPASILQQVKTQAADRFQAVPLNSSWYFFFNVVKKPFNNIYARQAVLAAMDSRAMSRLDSGFMSPDCHLIPFGIIGHNTPANCPFHNPTGPPNMALAQQLMAKSGMKGQAVTVWARSAARVSSTLDYFTSVLNSLGFKATEKVVNSGVYFTTIGDPNTKPQVGFGDWNQDFPHPWDFMQLFAGNAGSSLNYGYVNDPHYNQTLAKLYQVLPETVASQWQALDQYAVQHAYYAVYGHESKPKFFSNKLDFSKGTMSVEYLIDVTSLQLK